MSIDNAKKSITILGVLNIILGIFGIGLGVAFLSGGNMLGKSVIETAAPAAEGAAEALTMSGLSPVARMESPSVVPKNRMSASAITPTSTASTAMRL